MNLMKPKIKTYINEIGITVLSKYYEKNVTMLLVYKQITLKIT